MSTGPGRQQLRDPRRTGWEVLRSAVDSTIHVVPVDDLIAHVAVECPCGPTDIPETDEDGTVDWITSHNSLDGREHYE